MSQTQPADDWVNIPDIVVEYLNGFAKKLGAVEMRCGVLEQQLQTVRGQNQRLEAENSQLHAAFADFSRTTRTFATKNDLTQSQVLVQQKLLIPSEDTVEQLKIRLQAEISPEFFAPVAERFFSDLSAQLEQIQKEILRDLQRRPTVIDVQEAIEQKQAEVRGEETVFRQTLQQILKRKADIQQVNQVLAEKVSNDELSKAISHLPSIDDVNELRQQLIDVKNSEQTVLRQDLQQLKQKMNEQSSLQLANIKSILNKLQDQQTKISANSVQIASISAQAEQSLVISKQISNQMETEFRFALQPIVAQIELLKKSVQKLQVGLK